MNKHGGNRSPAFVQFGLYYRTSRFTVRIGPKLQYLRLKKNKVKEFIDPGALFCRNVGEQAITPPRFRDDTIIGQLAHNTLGISLRLVNFVDSHQDRDSSRPGVVNSLFGLGFDPIVRSDNQDNDIGHPGSPGTHGSERLVTWCVEKYQAALAVMNKVGTNVLGNTSSLTGYNIRHPHSVQEGGLAMVNVSHNSDNRRTRQQVLKGVRLLLQQVIDGVGLDINLETKFAPHKTRSFGFQCLIDRGHNTQLEKNLDDLRSLGSCQPREVTDRKPGGDTNAPGN